jgi:RNA polymerase sigma factor (TIGR02999 family)
MLPSRAEVTRLLGEMTGDPRRSEQLLPLVYEELRRLASSALSSERHERTLDATSLVHEAYLRLVGTEHASTWDGRHHFFAAAAITMRRILVERARRRARLRHGGGRARVALEDADPSARPEIDPEELLSLDQALTELEGVSPRRARVVMLRYFTGLTIEETASALGLAPSTVKEDWIAARAWLRRRIEGFGHDPG